jgi:NADPH:quinone reductase-like Zn-dependent oxidoreductase
MPCRVNVEVKNSNNEVFKMTDNFFQDKVVIVTGAASGIGLAVAEQFAGAGAKVVVSDIQVEAGQAAADRFGGIFVVGDLSQRPSSGWWNRRRWVAWPLFCVGMRLRQ